MRGQRSREKANKLSEERRSRLVSVGFTFRSKSRANRDRVFITIEITWTFIILTVATCLLFNRGRDDNKKGPGWLGCHVTKAT